MSTTRHSYETSNLTELGSAATRPRPFTRQRAQASMLSNSVRARAAHTATRGSRPAVSRLSTSAATPPRTATTASTPRSAALNPIASTSRLTLDATTVTGKAASRQSRSFTTSSAARLEWHGPFRSTSALAYPRAPRAFLREQETGESGENGNEGGKGKGEPGEGESDEAKVPTRRPGVPEKDQPRNGLKYSDSCASSSAAGLGAGSAEVSGAADGGDGASSGKGGNGSSIATRSVPDVYPQVMALPITRRPLFPGFYKAVVIRDQQVIKAIKESIKRGQPYIGAFLLKDENADSDV